MHTLESDGPYRMLAPPAPLRAAIRAFWQYAGYRPSHAMERVLPTGTLEIIIPLAGQELGWWDLSGRYGSSRRAIVCGPRRTAFDIPTAQQSRMAGIHFHPGGAWRLFGLAMSELGDVVVPMDEVLGPVADELEHAAGSGPAGQVLARLARFCLTRLPLGRASHTAVRSALGSAAIGQRRIAELVASTGLSHRRLIELFRREVGLTPRDYGRVQRLHLARSLLATRRAERLTDVAVQAGYYDQSHWLRECKKLVGLSPRSLVHDPEVPAQESGQIVPIG